MAVGHVLDGDFSIVKETQGVGIRGKNATVFATVNAPKAEIRDGDGLAVESREAEQADFNIFLVYDSGWMVDGTAAL